jgi:hypothetical protein
MQRKPSIFSLKYFPVLLLITYAGYQLYDYRQGYATYKIDGWCLKHKRDEVEFPKGNFFAARGIPMFWVPGASFDGPAEKSVVVSFKKYNLAARQSLIQNGVSLHNQCAVVPYNFGLVERVDHGGEKCTVSAFHRRFEPAQDFQKNPAVSITCGTDSKVLNCSIFSYMANGWLARISIPKENLETWREVVKLTENFFSKNFIDCGE